jgi:hypothetical protein
MGIQADAVKAIQTAWPVPVAGRGQSIFAFGLANASAFLTPESALVQKSGWRYAYCHWRRP